MKKIYNSTVHWRANFPAGHSENGHDAFTDPDI